MLILILVLILLILFLLYLIYGGGITKEDVLYAQELAAEYANESRKIYEMYIKQSF